MQGGGAVIRHLHQQVRMQLPFFEELLQLFLEAVRILKCHDTPQLILEVLQFSDSNDSTCAVSQSAPWTSIGGVLGCP